MRPPGRSWDRVPLRRADRAGRHRAPLRDEPDGWSAMGALVLVWAGAAGAGPEGLGWRDAAAQALAEAGKTLRGIEGMDVLETSAIVDGDKIKEYHTHVRIKFRIER